MMLQELCKRLQISQARTSVSASMHQEQDAIFCVKVRSAMFCAHLSQNWQAA